jgi:ribosomal protein L11 methylase PrmA
MTSETSSFHREPASFKDPAGFVFIENGSYYRQINDSYASEYDLLMSSGLYDKLVEKKLLIPHIEVPEGLGSPDGRYKTLLPEQLPFISYPYEWSFDQLKDAALLTLRVLKISLKHGMILKDATGFNVQFKDGQPIFIDTLSFERYNESEPWVAYRQFCECFLFPLWIEHYLQVDAPRWLGLYLEGIPAAMTAKLLPLKSRLKLGVWLHVHLQKALSTKPGQQTKVRTAAFSKEKLGRVVENLQTIIQKLRGYSSMSSTWNTYYRETILSPQYLDEKEKVFRAMVRDLPAGRVLDLGCNDGYFSKILAESNSGVIAADFDSQCINRLYQEIKTKSIQGITPICLDLTNPSPSLGFNHEERQSFAERTISDSVIVLALVHHLVLSKNLPLPDLARMLATLTKKNLVIEFVPISDAKSQQLIANKTAYHKPYDAASFEQHFGLYFELEQKQVIAGTERILYRMRRK